MGGGCATLPRRERQVSPEKRKSVFEFERDLKTLSENDKEEEVEDSLHGSALEVLNAGAIRLVRSTWLAQRPKTWVVEPFNELVDLGDALCHKDEAAKLFKQLLGVIVLSYGWFSREHPDPRGCHFSLLRKFLKCALAAGPGLAEKEPESYSKCAFQGLFWDFMCMPLPPSSEAVAATVKTGLDGMAILYGSPNTLVIQLKDMVTVHNSEGLHLLPYSRRGWCTFEETTSSILKHSHGFLDICLARERLAVEYAKWFEEDSLDVQGDCDIIAVYQSLEELATAERQPPMHPSDFKNLLSSKDFSYAASDYNLVINLYRQFFLKMCHRQSILMLCKPNGTGFGWERAECTFLAKSLPAFKQLKTLSFNGHAIGDEGIQALSTAISALPLRRIYLKDCTIGEASLRSISSIVPKMPFLQLLVLPQALKDCDGSKALRYQWRRCDKPQHAQCDDDGWPTCGIHWQGGSVKSPPRAAIEALTFTDMVGCGSMVVDLSLAAADW